MSNDIRRLTPAETHDVVALREEMLAAEPLAFLAGPETDRGSDPEQVRATLAGGPDIVMFGTFTDELVGMMGLNRARHAKAAHKMELFGMYVRPEARGRGLARRLLAAAIEHARGVDGVTQINLGVTETSAAACRLYAAMGFETWGTEPRGLVHEGRAVAVRHMVLVL